MKFADEVRFCFSIAMVNDDRNDVGVRLPPFECTGKKLILHHKHEELVQEEIKRVKSLPGNTALWRASNRPPNSTHQTDPTTKIKGIAKNKAAKLAEVGLNTVADVVN